MVYKLSKVCTEKDAKSVSKIVSDSSALILLAKCGLLETLCNIYEVISPSSVISEVASEEMVKNYPDANLIKGLISKGLINIQDPAKVEFRPPLALHQGEKDALLLAREISNSLFATDDRKAIKAAKFLNVPFIITPRIVVELFQIQKISFNVARESIEKLSIIGRYSPDIIANALTLLIEGGK